MTRLIGHLMLNLGKHILRVVRGGKSDLFLTSHHALGRAELIGPGDRSPHCDSFSKKDLPLKISSPKK